MNIDSATLLFLFVGENVVGVSVGHDISFLLVAMTAHFCTIWADACCNAFRIVENFSAVAAYASSSSNVYEFIVVQ